MAYSAVIEPGMAPYASGPGYEVDAGRFFTLGPAVRVYATGGDGGSIVLTPGEARELATILTAAARKAEGQGRS